MSIASLVKLPSRLSDMADFRIDGCLRGSDRRPHAPGGAVVLTGTIRNLLAARNGGVHAAP
jgi:hypothetical protein